MLLFTATTATRVKAATINSTTHTATAATIKTDTTTTAANANYAKGKFFEYTKFNELSWNTMLTHAFKRTYSNAS